MAGKNIYSCSPYLDPDTGKIRCNRCDRKSGQPPIVREGEPPIDLYASAVSLDKEDEEDEWTL